MNVEDSDFQRCVKHPSQVFTGFCSDCLVERLSNVNPVEKSNEIVEISTSSVNESKCNGTEVRVRKTLLSLFQLDDSNVCESKASTSSNDLDSSEHKNSKMKNSSLRSNSVPHTKGLKWRFIGSSKSGRFENSSEMNESSKEAFDKPRHSCDGSIMAKALTCSFPCLDEPDEGFSTQSLCGINVSPIRNIDAAKTLSACASNPVSVSSLIEVVSDDLLRLNNNLKSIIGEENPVLVSAAEQIFSAGGKRLRPALVFLVSRATAQLAGLSGLTTEHQRLAEIVEMIHTASLIHDDVLDDSGMRRGKETIHQLYGTRVAVLAGDFMFAQSSWYLANLENLPVIKLISQVIKDFASGEIKQASSLFDSEVTLEDYLLKSYYKTASLMAASTKSAAIFSRVDRTVCDQMYEYGKNLGLSFQVVDDILDFTQSAEQLGKPAGSDLAKGNLTAPVIYALKTEQKLRDIIDSEFSEDGSLDEAIELVHKCGGIEKARELAKVKADLALQNLKCLPNSNFKSSLEGMVKYNLERIE